MGQLEDLMEMKLCDNIFSSSKKENQKSGRNKCVVNEGEKERFRKKCWENKRKRKAGREEEGKVKKREGKKTGGRVENKTVLFSFSYNSKGKKYLLWSMKWYKDM